MPRINISIGGKRGRCFAFGKDKLERQWEELTWRLKLEKKLRVSSEDAKTGESSKLQKMVGSLKLELDVAKLAIVHESNKNAVLQQQLELSLKEKSGLEKEMSAMAELRSQNTYLKNSLIALEEKKSALNVELVKSRRETSDAVENLLDVQKTCANLQESLRSLESKLANMEDETCIRKLAFETPTPTKHIASIPRSLSDSRRTKSTLDRSQENYDLLARCIKEDLGFVDGKPVAACVIYKCLVHWHAFESERTTIFDYIIDGINDSLKVGEETVILPYWLSNASALLCLLQRNIRSNEFLPAASQRSGGPALNGRVAQVIKSPFKCAGLEDGISDLEARYPAILFKQRLTACVQKIFGLIRDNLKKEISPLLNSCIQAPKTHWRHGRKSSRSPGHIPQQSTNRQWDSIIQLLDSLMSRLHGNHVPSFFIRKIMTQVFSFVNISLFNSLLLRRECCTFSNGEYVKSGLAELDKWIVAATEEVIHQKRKKSLKEIMQDLCPVLTVRQICRISTMYWDDKYGTQSVSNEVLAQMKEILNKDSQNRASNSFLLNDDLSIPFSTEDIDMALPMLDLSVVHLPKFLTEYPSLQLLDKHQK